MDPSRGAERASRLFASISAPTRVAGAESIDLVSRLLPLSSILDQFVWISSAAAARRRPVLQTRVSTPLNHVSQADLRPSGFSPISLRRPSLRPGRYCLASGRHADLSALIRQPPNGAILLHRVTGPEGRGQRRGTAPPTPTPVG